MKIQLLIIDPQNDFTREKGSLYVPGAEDDMKRLATFIDKHGKSINRIHVSLDSHHEIHIAHPIFWQDAQGEMPKPFTIIALEDVTGAHPKWAPRHKEWKDKAIHYVEQLKRHGKYKLCIWPSHCIIGSWGHNVDGVLAKALSRYELQTFRPVNYIFKGQNCLTEHYSAIKADVIDKDDPSAGVNKGLLKTLKGADRLYVSGEALTHCVANTVEDIIGELGDEFASRITILRDTTSGIVGFESLGDDLLKKISELGGKCEKCSAIESA